MKKLIIVFLITLFLSFSLGIGISLGNETYGTVDTFKGTVSVIRFEETLDAEKGMKLFKEDSLKTGEDSSITVVFYNGIRGTLSSDREMPLSDLYYKANIEALKNNIKRPESDISPAKINVDTIGGTRGTEEGEKKSKDLKNEHHWEEKVE